MSDDLISRKSLIENLKRCMRYMQRVWVPHNKSYRWKFSRKTMWRCNIRA